MVRKPGFRLVEAAPAWELIAPLPSDLEMDDHVTSPSPSLTFITFYLCGTWKKRRTDSVLTAADGFGCQGHIKIQLFAYIGAFAVVTDGF